MLPFLRLGLVYGVAVGIGVVGGVQNPFLVLAQAMKGLFWSVLFSTLVVVGTDCLQHVVILAIVPSLGT